MSFFGFQVPRQEFHVYSFLFQFKGFLFTWFSFWFMFEQKIDWDKPWKLSQRDQQQVQRLPALWLWWGVSKHTTAFICFCHPKGEAVTCYVSHATWTYLEIIGCLFSKKTCFLFVYKRDANVETELSTKKPNHFDITSTRNESFIHTSSLNIQNDMSASFPCFDVISTKTEMFFKSKHAPSIRPCLAQL